MSRPTFSLETHLRVYDDQNGQYLLVTPDGDSTGCVQLSADASQEEYWGKICLVVQPGMARLLAKALIQVADSLDEAETERFHLLGLAPK
jgi:hypothetical protein